MGGKATLQCWTAPFRRLPLEPLVFCVLFPSFPRTHTHLRPSIGMLSTIQKSEITASFRVILPGQFYRTTRACSVPRVSPAAHRQGDEFCFGPEQTQALKEAAGRGREERPDQHKALHCGAAFSTSPLYSCCWDEEEIFIQ